MGNEIIKTAISCIQKYEQGSGEYALGAYVLSREMSETHFAQLSQLVKSGPVFDGDTIGKQACRELVSWDLAVKVCHNGEQGFTAATYAGYDVWRARGIF